MQLTTSWKVEGIVEGLHRGKRDLILRQFRRRFLEVPKTIEDRIDALSDSNLDQLAEAPLDFTSLADAQSWLNSHAG